ncbi:hypothetical protein [Devosia lacusdianchii]|uniref:hypothetical protein n=1 Tax=Devosia lacusdianchii TaxID=2917991 RepID=UPI001F05E31A|nr:hypothetical protein [Devosia sp. JXJ CY 41]
MQRFIDDFVSREQRFSLGRDTRTGGLYLSTPVSGRRLAAEYEAYFTIDAGEYARFRADPALADGFVEDCRMGRQAARLISPG